MKKFVCLFLSILLLLALLVSCQETPKIEDETTLADGETTTLEGEVTTNEEETTQAEAEKFLTLVENGTTEYKIVYPENANETVMTAVNKLCNAFETYTGVKPQKTDDYLKENENEGTYEILVGQTNRTASATALEYLRTGEYFYGVDKTKLVLIATTDNALTDCVNAFIKNYVSKAQDNTFLFYNSASAFSSTNFYINEIKLNGRTMAGAQIVIPQNYTIEYYLAKLLRMHLSVYSGWVLDIVTDDKAEKKTEILLGNTNRTTISADEGTYKVQLVGNKLMATADTCYGLLDCYHTLRTEVFPYTEESVSWTSGKIWSSSVSAPDTTCNSDVRIMVHNLWGSNNDYERSYISDRGDLALTVYQNYMPDIICFQEATTAYRNLAQNTFTWLNENYKEIKYSSLAIFYNSEWTLVKKGTLKITDYVTSYILWAVLKDANGNQVGIVVSHFPSGWNADTVEEAETWRMNDATKTTDIINSIKESYPSAVICAVGDYNCSTISNPYQYVLTNANLTNARDLATIKNEKAPYHGDTSKTWYNEKYDVFALQSSITWSPTGSIDHFLIGGNTETLTVEKYLVATDQLALTSSDHAPHYADISFGK